MEVEKEWPLGGQSSVQVEKGESVNSLLTIANNTELYIWVSLAVKNLPANAGDVREAGSIPGWGRSPGGGNGNLLQYSWLENLHGQKSLAGYSPWGCQESDTTEYARTFFLSS